MQPTDPISEAVGWERHYASQRESEALALQRQRMVNELSIAIHGEAIAGAPEDVWRQLLRTVEELALDTEDDEA